MNLTAARRVSAGFMNLTIFSWMLAALLLTAIQPVQGLTVRVDASSGAPRLLVNGKPVRGRMFFGIQADAPLKIGPQGAELRFEFLAQDDATTGTMHFRFGSSPGRVDLDEIRVVDLDDGRDVIPTCAFEDGPASLTGRWAVWPPDRANTVGKVSVEKQAGRGGSAGLSVVLTAPTNGSWPDFHIHHAGNLRFVRGHRYRVTLWARAVPQRDLTIGFYRPGNPYVSLGGPPGPFASQIQMAAKAGVDFVSMPIDMPWPRPGQDPDWRSVDLACEQVLAANPRALLLPRMGMMPPPWWQQEHPDEVMQWDNGRRGLVVVASPRYRREAAERLSALVTHLEAKYGDHVAGYHPCGQNTGEWFYEGTWEPALNGYAPADLRAWRAWLKERYATDQKLRLAWQDAAVTIESARVPSPEARRAAPSGVFRDPLRERPLGDWAEFQQDAMSQCVIELAQAARKASSGRKLVVFFSGYVFEFATIPTGPAVSGHYALRRLLNCPDIDVLCSPISYFDRGLGQSAPSMTAAESVALAGKLWLNEDDTRTYLGTGNFPGAMDAVSTLEDTNRELVRNVGQEALRNFATWWMDLGATGWFNDARMWERMERLDALDRPLLEHPLPFRPEVAAVIDERAMLMTAPAGITVTHPGVYEVRASLGRMGAPYGQYLLDDVAAGRVRARLYVMLNAWRFDARERAALARTLRGSTVLWCYAPGYFDGDRASLEAMTELTGFQFDRRAGVPAKATPTESGRLRGLTRAFGPEQPLQPLFAVTGSQPVDVLARYADNSAAVALRRGPDGTQIFVGAPGLTSELLRLAAREAGVHLYTETDCNVYANGPFVVLHASADGPVDLRWPPEAEGSQRSNPRRRVKDVLSREIVGAGSRVTIPLHRGDTRVLRLEDASDGR